MRNPITPTELINQLTSDILENGTNIEETVTRLETIKAIMTYEQEAQRFQTRKMRSAMGELMSAN